MQSIFQRIQMSNLTHCRVSLVRVQWVQLHLKILRNTDFAPTDFEEIWFSTLHFLQKCLLSLVFWTNMKIFTHSSEILTTALRCRDLFYFEEKQKKLAMIYWAFYSWLNQDYLLWSLRCIPSLFLLNLQSCVVVLGTFAANSIPYVRMALLYTHLILDRKKSNLFAIDEMYLPHFLLIENINIL